MVKNWKAAGEIDGERILKIKKDIVPYLLPPITQGKVSLADAIMALVELQHDLLVWAETHSKDFLLQRIAVDPQTGKVIE